MAQLGSSSSSQACVALRTDLAAEDLLVVYLVAAAVIPRVSLYSSVRSRQTRVVLQYAGPTPATLTAGVHPSAAAAAAVLQGSAQ